MTDGNFAINVRVKTKLLSACNSYTFFKTYSQSQIIVKSLGKRSSLGPKLSYDGVAPYRPTALAYRIFVCNVYDIHIVLVCHKCIIYD